MELFNTERDRGQVGIGTLIVFIAMVLVAAIAAGVLVDTAGFLQSKSQQTGEDSTDKVTNRIEVVDSYGEIDYLDPASEDGGPADNDDYYVAADGDGTNDNYLVYNLSFVMMRSAGSDNIKLADTVLLWQGPDGAEEFTLDNSSVTIHNIDGASDNVLNDDSDRARVEIKLDPLYTGAGDNKNLALDALKSGEEVTLKFTTVSGATVRKTVSMPSTYPSSDGAIIDL